jgi:RNA polymerase sigma-70 factor, ECF subfamily
VTAGAELRRSRSWVGYPFTTPSGVRRRTGRTSDVDAAITTSMSLYAKSASSATVLGSPEWSATPREATSIKQSVDSRHLITVTGQPWSVLGAGMERDLVLAASSGSNEAFGVLVARSADRCYALAYRILRDVELAQDAVQAALLGAWEGLPGLRDPDRFDVWLTRLVVNACYAEARRQRRWTTKLHLIPADHPALADTAVSVADRDELERAFRRLPPEQRAVVVLHHYRGLSLAEVATTLGIPAGTARSRLHHATRQLRAAVDADARPASISEGHSA